MNLRPELAVLADQIREIQIDTGPTAIRSARARDMVAAAISMLDIDPGPSAMPQPPGQATGPLVNITLESQTQSQTRAILQPLSADWGEGEREIDADENIAPENKEQAKSLLRKIREGVRDTATIIGIATGLAKLGMNPERAESLIGALVKTV